MNYVESFILLCVIVCIAILVYLVHKMGSLQSSDAADASQKELLDRLSEGTRLAQEDIEDRIDEQGRSYYDELSRTREELSRTLSSTVTTSVASMGNSLRQEQAAHNETLERRFSAQSDLIEQRLSSQSTLLGERLDSVSGDLQRIQRTNHDDMERLRASNQESLDRINGTVSEKLQSTLNEQLSHSFEQVTRHLKEVNVGLGEMRDVAQGVSDLKRVLSNVKQRGIVGEYQLKAILDEILTADQYEEQVKVRPRSSERVDFAIKMPGASTGADGQDQEFIYLPIDSKFPADAYEHLLDAMDGGDPEEVKACRKVLENAVRTQAKSIADKYVSPPVTTNFAIMFFPFEGLYSEVVNMPGLVGILQEKYRVNVAGPSTMAALLNSLQMGFRTLEIQQKSSEVWKILERARQEFATFEKVLEQTRTRLRQADDELEKLVGVRTRQINQALSKVELPGSSDEDQPLLGS